MRWRLLIGLVLFHALLIVAVHYLPLWIGGRSMRFTIWSRVLHGSLGNAQFQLLAACWAIAGVSWAKRTAWFVTGLALLWALQVAIMVGVDGAENFNWEVISSLAANAFDVFVIDTLVTAVLLELLRPLWGSLTQEDHSQPEPLTIYTLLRTTTMGAVAAFALRLSLGFSESPVAYAGYYFRDTALTASCIALTLLLRYRWIGALGCMASVAGGVWLTPSEIVVQHGQWHWLPGLVLGWFWLSSTLLIIRCFGFQLRKPQQHATHSGSFVSSVDASRDDNVARHV